MKLKSLPNYCLLPVLTSASMACNSLVPLDTSVNQSVIESMTTFTPSEQPWRLDSAQQNGGLGGSVLRPASIEHVVRQIDQPVSVQLADTGDVTLSTRSDNHDDDPLVIERAWRKYCHHQLDMTAEEQALVKHTTIPYNVLNHGCTPVSLKK